MDFSVIIKYKINGVKRKEFTFCVIAFKITSETSLNQENKQIELLTFDANLAPN